ncbi:MAG: alginate lyase family protein [Ignavibacteriae bacterium]|nr:alginate lyase family protein [Ignavibacteriota bacterium]
MMNAIFKGVALLCVVFAFAQAQQSRPNLIISADEARSIKQAVGKYPYFDRAYEEAKRNIEDALSRPIDVPLPKDAGGYTHEKHKQNYREMQLAGFLFSVTNDARYATFVRDMLMRYAELYPTLPNHPMGSSEAVGKIFWQTLNESVWLVHVAQAYDCVYDWLTPSDREKIESKLLRPMAHFFTVEHVREHDRIHNHGTWTVAATGMLGFALRDNDLIDKALYGTKKNKQGGFIRQLDLLFSPDGYYTEGPYYTRYAIMPFFLFAQAIQNNRPALKIFEYRNQILKKAFYAALQQTYTNGCFIPINDALKEMSFLANEIVIALNIAYAQYGGDNSLLSIAKKQKTVMLSGAGLKVAEGLAAHPIVADFNWHSIELTDGPQGDKGGVGILRSGNSADQSLVLMKYSAHGESHGHFDKLTILYSDQGREILQDYGAVRFINVEPKNGGRYLPETSSWARQTIAHNTVTVDGISHYQGKIDIAEKQHADRHFFSVTDSFQIMSARVAGTYLGVEMQRTVALVNDNSFKKPVIIDVFRVVSDKVRQLDLPFYYLGHLITTNVKYTANDKQRTTLGKSNGYQHLWLEGEGKASGPVKVTWLNGSRYYSVVSSADSSTSVLFTRIGAGDPNFNLRNEPAFMLREKAASHVFASVIETHGSFDGVTELALGSSGRIDAVSVLASNAEASVIEISGKDVRWILMIANGPSSGTAKHTMSINGAEYSWTGNYSLKRF